MVPQARRLFQWIRQANRLSWLHTCGKMNRLIFDGAYDRDQMGVDVLESFSGPPLGDVENLRAARARVGNGITTRGGINVGELFSDTAAQIRARARYVLDSTTGFRHMIGDTDCQFPGTPVENLRAVVETVREYGRAFRG